MDYDYEVLENGDGTEEDYAVAMQQAINGGVAWKFQGSVGRDMMAALEAGICMLGKTGAADYYGNYIPSRDQVQEGTKGSYQYVAEKMGAEYADMMAAL